MVLKSLRVPVMLVEVLDQVLGSRPHIHSVRRVAKVVREAAAKVAGAEDENLGLVIVLLVRKHLEACGRYDTGPEACVES